MDEIKRIKDLKSEEGADEIASSPEMQPYLQLAIAMMQNADQSSSLEEIARLPLEKRYVWRVASALKWAFADFDDINVVADRETLSEQDLARLLALLQHRPIQFCLFLKSLVGPEEMKRFMLQAISIAGRSGPVP